MKLYLCLLMAVVIAIFFAYFAGGRVANERCRAQINAGTLARQTELVNLQGGLDVEVLNRGVGDIRRILHKKYTIAE